MATVRTKRPGVGLVIASPGRKGGVGYVDTQMLVNVFSRYHGRIHLFSDHTYEAEFGVKGVQVHRAVKPYADASFAKRILGHFIYQLRLASLLSRHAGEMELVCFIFGGELLFIPHLTLLLRRKKRLMFITGSLFREHRLSHPGLIGGISLGFVWLGQHLTYSLMNSIVVYSENMVAFGGLKRYEHKIKIWHYFTIDSERFCPSVDYDRRDLVVGLIGRIDLDKGVLKFASALPAILEQNPEVRFLVVGDGQETDRLKALLEAGGCLDKVEFRGWLAHEELPAQMNRLKFIVMPSETEGLPNVLIEAMACGAVPVTTLVGDIPLLLQDGETGYALPDNSPQAIAAGVNRALADPRLAEIARRTAPMVLDRYTYGKALDGYRHILETLVGWRRLPRTLQTLSMCIILPDSSIDVSGSARSIFVEVFARYLPAWGHRVDWVMPSEKTVEPYSFNGSWVYPIKYPAMGSVVGRLWSRTVQTYRKMRRVNALLRAERYDLLMVSDTLADGLLGTYFKRKYGIPFFFKRDDIISAEWYGTTRVYRYSKPLFWLLVWLSRRALGYVMRRADLVIAVSDAARGRLATGEVDPARVIALPRGANEEFFAPELTGTEIRGQYGLGQEPVVVYIGTTARIRHLEVLVAAFARVRAQKVPARLLIVGHGDNGYLSERVRGLGLESDVVLTGEVPYSKVPQYIAVARVAVSLVPPLDIYKASSPTKLFEYMAMGKAVVASREILEHENVILESQGGILVSFDEEDIARALLTLLSDPALCWEMGRRGREWLAQHRSYRVLAEKVVAQYMEALGMGTPGEAV